MSVVLIPVDFFQPSFDAVDLGFQFAARLNAEAVLLHAYSPVYMPEQPPVYDSFDFGEEDTMLETDMLQHDVESEAKRMMDMLVKGIQNKVASGILPQVKFSHVLMQGVPEDVIRSYARSESPIMIVMATRGKDKKGSDLMGSVAAEVLDTCRIPVFTVPENPLPAKVVDIRKIAFFCTLKPSDMDSMKCFMDMFGNPDVDVMLLPVPDEDDAKNIGAVNEFSAECAKAYPKATFSTAVIPEKDFRKNLENCITQQKVEMLVVPNRKTNIFSRIFNPALPHKILFEKDIPMLSLPV